MSSTHPSDMSTMRAPAVARHVLVGVPWGATWLVVVVGGALAGLAVLPLGLLMWAAIVWLIPLGADIERDRVARLLGVAVDRAEPVPRARLADQVRMLGRSRTTWREAGYLLTFGLLSTVSVALVAAWAVATVAALTGGWWLPDGSVAAGPIALPRPVIASLLGVNGVAGVLVGPALARGLAVLHGGHAARLLGSRGSPLRVRLEAAERRRELLAQAARTERERIERDLHDGLQPVLVATALTIAGARRHVEHDPGRATEDLEYAQAQLQMAMGDLRSLVQGLAPRSLRESGLDTALGELAAGAPVPTELETQSIDAVDEEVAAAAYFVASEALTNAVRHGSARHVSIRVELRDGHLDVAVRDDGIGGAVPRPGRGLHGLDARVRALGGDLSIASPRGGGTLVQARIPAGAMDPVAASRVVVSRP